MGLTPRPSTTRRTLLRSTLLITASVVLAPLLAACSQAATPSSTPQAATSAATAASAAAPTQPAANTASAQAPAATAAPAGQKVTITVFNRQTQANETPKGMVPLFEQAHPNVTINWESAPPGADLQKMLILAAAGNSPDIQWQCLPCDFDQFIYAGLVLPIDGLIKSHNYAVDSQMPQAMATANWKGQLYGLPDAMHPDYSCVCINKTMFEKAGIAIPAENWTTGPHPGWKDWTFDTMKQAAIALTQRSNGRVVQWGLQVDGYANPYNVIQDAIRSEGGDMLNTDGTKLTWNSDAGRKAVSAFVDLYTKDKVAPLTPDMPSGGPDLMASGKVAIRYAPCWLIGTAQQTFKSFEWMVLPAPLGAAGSDADAQANYFSIMKVTKQPDTAFDVLVGIIDPQWMWKSFDLGGLPGSQKEFWSADSRLMKDPNWAVFGKMMQTVSPLVLPANGRLNELITAWNSDMDPVWLGQTVDTNSLIDQLTPKLQTIVDKPTLTLQELSKPTG